MMQARKISLIESSSFLDLKYINELVNGMADKMMEAEEQVLLEVLEKYLGRIPTVEDYKKCERMIKEGQPEKYLFGYDKNILGRIERIMEAGTCKVTFTPNTNEL